ncbi:MAG: HPF/RaiA family ribosome-associated protein [Bacteroidota bacterium]|nr:HPF/RaiA family ribosome-associated protein [Bacteroidota bacterium]
MTINIHSIHFHIDDKLQEFIEKKMKKIFRLDKKIIATDVFLKLSKAASYSNKIAKIKLRYPSSEFFAKRQTDTFEESTTQVFQALRKQILKNKAKKVSNH